MEFSKTVTVHFVELNDARDAAFESALLLLLELLNEFERQEPQAVTELFGTAISLQQPAQAG